MDRRRLIYYLLLNVFVSACVTLGILYWYDRNYRAVSLPQIVPAASAATTGALPVQTVRAGQVQIVSIVGAGTLTAETVTIQYKGEGELDLSSWQLRDASGNSFTFPPFKLFKNGAVRVHTANGTNTAIDLYWGQSRALWQSGSSVQLMDPQGNVQDSYPVP